MAITVYVPTPYRELTDGQARVRGEGQDLAEVISDLDGKYPGIRDRICENGDLRHYVNVYVNGEEVRALGGLTARLQDGDEVAIIPSLAGGRQPCGA
jgi:MoaD family protein